MRDLHQGQVADQDKFGMFGFGELAGGSEWTEYR